ncbi:MAG: hypothetical protein IMY73_04860 [Bacteroidetes bacterium]|nr:hypothetical protein [Bacteroidota bacterium]
MKKLMMIMVFLLGIMSSCTDDKVPEKPKEFKLDENAILYVNGGGTKAETETAEYIVKNASFFHCAYLDDNGTLKRRDNGDVDYGGGSLGLDDYDYKIIRDLIKHRFKFSGSAIFFNGKPLGSFFNCVDITFVVVVHNGKRISPKEVTIPLDDEIKYDTVAYIPNSVARQCKAKILTAFEVGDLFECYRVFREDYSFVPITGEQFRKLKAEGKNNIFE